MGSKRLKAPELLWSSAELLRSSAELLWRSAELLRSSAQVLRSSARSAVSTRWALRLGRGVATAVALGWPLGIAVLPLASSAAEAEDEASAGATGTGREAGAAQGTLSAVERGVREADELLLGARFEEALARIDALREGLEDLGGGDAERRLRARTEVMAATAYVALDRDDAARDCFRRALAAEPALDLDPATTSPKVLRVFRAVREEPRGPR